MGKVLGKIGKVVSIVGFAVGVIATGGLLAAGAPLLTAVGTGFGAVVGGLGISANALILGGAIASGIGASIMKGPRLEDDGDASRGQAYVDASAPGAFVFGETVAPSAVVFEQNHGADKEYVSVVLAHAWHRIESYVSLHVDGEAVAFSGVSATGEYAGVLSWATAPGYETPGGAISLPGTVWPAAALGAGVAHSAMVWNFKDQDKLTGGVPNRLVVKVRGAHMYDPRLDTTVGGSGAHRYDDPSTWTYNPGNAALVALRYIIGERSASGALIWGVGEPVDNVDLDSFIAMANVADEVRDGAPRFQLSGYFQTTNDHQGFFQKWEANTGGKIARIGGKRFIWLPHDDLTPIDTITDNDIVANSGVSLRVGQEVRELYNTARGRYISPDELYQGTPYPEVTEAQAVTDDGRPRVLDVDFGWIQIESIAERVARYGVRRSRFGRRWRVAVGWKGVLYAPFSVLNLNTVETLGVNQLVRVIDKQMSPGGVVVLTLQEENAAIYDDTVLLGDSVSTLAIPDRLDRLGTLSPRFGFIREVPDELTDGRIPAALNPDGTIRGTRVVTESLVENAATALTSAYTAGSVNWSSSSVPAPYETKALLQSITIASPSGGPVQLIGTATVIQNGSPFCDLRIRRIQDGVSTYLTANQMTDVELGVYVLIDEPDPDDSVTYEFWALAGYPGYSGVAALRRTLMAFEAKR